MVSTIKNRLIYLLSIVILLVIWKISAINVNAEIILPHPESVLHSLLSIFSSKEFLINISSTILRGLRGFLISFVLGLTAGILSGLFRGFKTLLSPLLTIIRSTPVIAVILLALIWFNVDNVPVFVAFLMAFPVITTNITEGMYTVDKKLLEMADIYRINWSKKILHIYIPSIMPFIISGISISLGLIWKVVVAAEVLSQPTWGLGTTLNEAKSYLITEEVFAWTLVAILLSSVTEQIFTLLSKKLKVGRV